MTKNPLDVAKALQARAPWETGSKVLELVGVKRSRGWQNTIDSLASGDIKLDDDDAEKLVGYLEEHIECGEKQTRIYRLEPSAIGKLATQLRSSINKDDPLAELYPLSLEPAGLEEAELEWGRLIHARTGTDEEVFVFSGVRAVEMHVRVDPATLPKEVRASLEGYSELIGVQERRIQTMDVIRVSKSGDGIVEVRCDFPTGLSAEAVSTSVQTLHAKIAQAVGPVTPLNFFPAIDPMFKAPNEGDVVEAAFTTHTGSVKHERMRRNKTSLRNEPYHKAGKRAISDALDVYKLALRWSFTHSKDVTSEPEVFFNGTRRMVAISSPWLPDVALSGCLGDADYCFVRDKIISYLPK